MKTGCVIKGRHFKNSHIYNLITASVLILHHLPRFSIIAICNFKLRNKLHHSEVLCTLSDDARETFYFLEINLKGEQRKMKDSAGFEHWLSRVTGTVSLTWIHSERLLWAGDQAFVFPDLSSRANWGCQVKVSMPHVRKVLEDESCSSEMSRDFIPRGSEQPAVFE